MMRWQDHAHRRRSREWVCIVRDAVLIFAIGFLIIIVASGVPT